MPAGRINLTNPVNWKHPLNTGRLAWFAGLSQWSGGNTWFDLCRRNNGTLTNGPVWTPELYGMRSLKFDGVNDTVPLPAGPLLSATTAGLWISAMVWFDPAASAAPYLVFGGDNESGFPIGANGAIQLMWDSAAGVAVIRMYSPAATQATSSISGLAGTWTRLDCWYDGVANSINISVNGRPPGSATPAAAPTGASISPTIGSRPGGALAWAGKIADVSVRRKAPSMGELKSDIDQSRRGYPDLLAQFDSTAALDQAFAPPPVGTGGRNRRFFFGGG